MARKKKNAPGGSSSLNTPFLAEGSIIARSAPKIGESNRGRQMLEAMGYQDGEALGRERGRANEPILLRFKGTTAGLGAVVGKKNRVLKHQRHAARYVSFVASTSTSTEVRVAVGRPSQMFNPPREPAAMRHVPEVTSTTQMRAVTTQSHEPTNGLTIMQASPVIMKAIAEANRRPAERGQPSSNGFLIQPYQPSSSTPYQQSTMTSPRKSISKPLNVQMSSKDLCVPDHEPQPSLETASTLLRTTGDISRPAFKGLASSMYASSEHVLTTPFSRLSVHDSVSVGKSSIPDSPTDGVKPSTMSSTEDTRLRGVMAKNKGLKLSCWA